MQSSLLCDAWLTTAWESIMPTIWMSCLVTTCSVSDAMSLSTVRNRDLIILYKIVYVLNCLNVFFFRVFCSQRASACNTMWFCVLQFSFWCTPVVRVRVCVCLRINEKAPLTTWRNRKGTNVQYSSVCQYWYHYWMSSNYTDYVLLCH